MSSQLLGRYGKWESSPESQVYELLRADSIILRPGLSGTHPIHFSLTIMPPLPAHAPMKLSSKGRKKIKYFSTLLLEIPLTRNTLWHLIWGRILSWSHLARQRKCGVFCLFCFFFFFFKSSVLQEYWTKIDSCLSHKRQKWYPDFKEQEAEKAVYCSISTPQFLGVLSVVYPLWFLFTHWEVAGTNHMYHFSLVNHEHRRT